MKITFLLLLSGGEDIFLATSILFPSIIDNFQNTSIEKIIIIVKDVDHKLLIMRLEELKEKVKHNLKINVISESEIMKTDNIKNTYYLQMYLKLLASKLITTEYYITLDADVIFFNKSNLNDFISKDDNNILKPHFYKTKKLDVWTKRSIQFLKYEKPVNFTINQTPFVFKTELVTQMLNDIDVKDLILNKLCSEYTLFFIYLLKKNIFDDNYKFHRFSEFSVSYPITLLAAEKLNKFIRILKNNKKPILIIQSRIKMHLKLKDFIKEISPSSYYKKEKIGLLTCVSGKEYVKRYKESFKIKQHYCMYHNYTFIYENVNPEKFPKGRGWIKLYKLKQKLSDYDYIFVSDADVIITNKDIRIEDIIFKYMKEDHNMLITSDYNSINSGNMIWKNNGYSKSLINEIIKLGEDKIRYSLKKPYIPKGIYEQPSIIYFINKYEDIKKRIKVIPQFEMNSYSKIMPILHKKNIIKKINNIQNRCNWEKNDFLIHFAGFNYMKDGEFEHKIEKVIDKFNKIYYENIKEKEGSDYGKIK